jgi:hypothetical protein
MKNFEKFLEAVRGNPGIPAEYFGSAERKKREELNRNRPENHPSQMMRLSQEAERLTRGHERELEELATKVIKNHYKGLIERYNIKYDIRLTTRGSEMARLLGIRESVETEKYKRKIINLVTQGEAKNVKHILHSEEVKEGINEIFGEADAKRIFKIWDEITKMADMMDQDIPPEDRARFNQQIHDTGNDEMLAGAVKVEWGSKDEDKEEEPEQHQSQEEDEEDYENRESFYDDDEEEEQPSGNGLDDEQSEEIEDLLNNNDVEGLQNYIDENDISREDINSEFYPTVVALGRDFPMLIHEAVKGTFQVLAMNAIPEDREEAVEALNKGMARHEEPEEWKWGPMVAADIRDFINQNENVEKYPNVREIVWKNMIDKKTMPSEEFLELVKGILSNSEKARIKVDTLINKIVKGIKAEEDYKEAEARYQEELKQYEEDMKKYEEDMKKWEEVEKKRKEKSKPKEENEIEQIRKKAVEKETDYASMSPSELQKAIDAALDVDDYTLAHKISTFMKNESKQIYQQELKMILEHKNPHTK